MSGVDLHTNNIRKTIRGYKPDRLLEYLIRLASDIQDYYNATHNNGCAKGLNEAEYDMLRAARQEFVNGLQLLGLDKLGIYA